MKDAHFAKQAYAYPRLWYSLGRFDPRQGRETTSECRAEPPCLESAEGDYGEKGSAHRYLAWSAKIYGFPASTDRPGGKQAPVG